MGLEWEQVVLLKMFLLSKVFERNAADKRNW